MTFDEITADAQSMTKDTSNAAKAVIRKGINKGLIRLRAKLRRKYAIVTRQFTFTVGQNEYQLPEGAVRLARLSYVEGGDRHDLIRVDDENEWGRMQGQVGETGQPQFFFVVSKDTFKVYPAPSVAATGIIKYQSRAKQLSADDYSEGTISIDNGSQTVTSTGATFTANMVGRSIKLDNSESEKSDYYQIIAVDTVQHQLTLENFYDGTTKADAEYIIGEVPNIPAEYHPALSDYGVYYFYLWRKDKAMAAEFQANFLQALAEIEVDYSSDVVSNVIESKRHRPEGSMLPTYRRTPRAVDS